jgi:hypothetical protein
LAISEAGVWELWEQSSTAAGVELRGMVGCLVLVSAGDANVNPNSNSISDTIAVVRFTKTAERLVLPTGQTTAECSPQFSDGTLLSVASCATLVALELCAFGGRLLFWRSMV